MKMRIMASDYDYDANDDNNDDEDNDNDDSDNDDYEYDDYDNEDDTAIDTWRGTQSYGCPAPALPCRADSENGQIFEFLLNFKI